MSQEILREKKTHLFLQISRGEGITSPFQRVLPLPLQGLIIKLINRLDSQMGDSVKESVQLFLDMYFVLAFNLSQQYMHGPLVRSSAGGNHSSLTVNAPISSKCPH